MQPTHSPLTICSCHLWVVKLALRLIRTAPLFLLVPAISGCGSSSPSNSNDKNVAAVASADSSEPPISPPQSIVLKPEQSANLVIYSKPSGCMVFVDLVPVRGDGDTLALTPCELTVPRGRHTICVEKPGGRRKTESLLIDGNQELEFDVGSSSGEFAEPSLINAPLFDAAVGRSIGLESLNSPNQDLDPFLSADGLTVYFASDRGGIRGIYIATRPSPYHYFGEPQIVPASTGADMPVSPSASGDGLILVYAVPEKSRIWQLVRTDVSAPFGGKEIIRTDEKAERAWRSAQLSDDGLRLYWTEEGSDATVTRAAVRSAPSNLFGKTLAFDLAGHHPHLCADGRRHFTFDGEKLRRARRGSVKQPFGEPEVIAELTLNNYTASSGNRQFWVSDDEQWMIYCDDPRNSSDLFIVRLSDGPGWGRQFVAKQVADKMEVAKVEPQETSPPESTPREKEVDPRSLPLPYTKYWTELTTLLTERKGEDATTLVQASMANRELSSERLLLTWDLELAESQAEFNRDLDRAVTSMKPGTPVRVGGTKFEFNRFEDGILHLKVKEKEFTRKFSDLSPGELVTLADTGTEKGDAVKALRFAIYLHFQGAAQHSIAESWFRRAGPAGVDFFERLARRTLKQAQSELARGNVAAGMKLLEAVQTVGGTGTIAASEVAKERERVYEKSVWSPVGPRKWQRGELGEFIADSNRSNGSFLKSEQSYRDFDFQCEWKVLGGTSMGGVILRYPGQGKPVEKGAKIQLASDSTLNKPDAAATGALFGVTAPSLMANVAEGKWNTLQIQVRGTVVQTWINDKQVLQATLGKGIPSSGYVLLDGAAGGICYRKVLIFEPTPSP